MQLLGLRIGTRQKCCQNSVPQLGAPLLCDSSTRTCMCACASKPWRQVNEHQLQLHPLSFSPHMSNEPEKSDSRNMRNEFSVMGPDHSRMNCSCSWGLYEVRTSHVACVYSSCRFSVTPGTVHQQDLLQFSSFQILCARRRLRCNRIQNHFFVCHSE